MLGKNYNLSGGIEVPSIGSDLAIGRNRVCFGIYACAMMGESAATQVVVLSTALRNVPSYVRAKPLKTDSLFSVLRLRLVTHRFSFFFCLREGAHGKFGSVIRRRLF